MGERGLFRGHVRFADSVDLYVGHEDDLIMRNWPHALEVPHPKAKVFTPIETIPNSEQLDVGDDVSFVAAHVHRQQNFPVQQHQEPEIMNDPEIVIDDNHIDDVHAESESDSESLSSAQLQIYAQGRWFTTMIFALDRYPITMRLDWNDYEGLHHSIAAQLNIPPGDLCYVHYVATRPQDLARASVEAVIAHREGDLPVGSLQRITLFPCQ
jgi:hypothetical protein